MRVGPIIILGNHSVALAEQMPVESTAAANLVVAARDRTSHELRYDGRYISLEYPGGDIPADSSFPPGDKLDSWNRRET